MPPLVILEWLDAHSPGSTEVVGPENLNDLHTPLLVSTTGWLLRDDSIGVTIACEHVGGKEYRGVTFVPRGMVMTVTPVNKPRARKKSIKAIDPTPPPVVD